MKVLIIPAWYPNGDDKLIGNYHIEFTESLNEYGIKADMLFVYRMRLKDPISYLKQKRVVVDKYDKFNCYIHKMLNVEPISSNWQLKNYIKTLDKALKKYIKENGKPDILHAHTVFLTGYATCILGKKYNIPVVVTDHSDMWLHIEEIKNHTVKGPGIFNHLSKSYPKLYDYCMYVLKNSYNTAVCDYMLDTVREYTDKLAVLPNIVDVDSYTLANKREIKDTFNLVSCCAFREGKNVDVVIEAVKNLQKRGYNNIRYTIIGEGYLGSFFKDRAKQLDAYDVVKFVGRKNKNEINEIYKNSHCLVMPSFRDTFAIPVLEAMATGIPVIISEFPGPREYTTKENAIIFNHDNIKELEEAILEMMNNYDSYDPKKQRAVAMQFSKKAVSKIAEEIYKKAI